MKEKIEAILANHDPIKLIKMGAPQNEYSSEAQMIWERTSRHFSLDKIHNIIYDVFYRQFGTGTAYKANRKGEMIAIGEDVAPHDFVVGMIGKFEEYLSLATEIKNLLDQEKTRPT